MPTYLVHGFRWQRAMIRIHIILNDLEDAAAEWIMAPATSVTLLNSFYSLYDFLPPSHPPPPSYSLPAPHAQVLVDDEVEGQRTLSKSNSSSLSSLRSLNRNGRPATSHSPSPARPKNWKNGTTNGTKSLGRSTGSSTRSASTMQRIEEKAQSFNDWSVVKLLEQYDMDDLEAVSQPYAYVADYMIEISLGISLTEEMAKYEARVKAEEGTLSPTRPRTSGDLSMRDVRRKSKQLGWLEKLRDGLQKGAAIEWFVVVVGDEERIAPDVEPDLFERNSGSTAREENHRPLRSTKSMAGLRGLFNRKKNIADG